MPRLLLAVICAAVSAGPVLGKGDSPFRGGFAAQDDDSIIVIVTAQTRAKTVSKAKWDVSMFRGEWQLIRIEEVPARTGFTRYRIVFRQMQ